MTTAQLPEPIPLPSDLTCLRTRLLSAGSAAVRTDELLAVLLGGRDALAAGRAALDQLGLAGIREAGPD